MGTDDTFEWGPATAFFGKREAPRIITPMRGQAVIREDLSVHTRRGSIIVPEVSNIDNRNAVARSRKWHIGTVLALGAPMRTKTGAEVSWGCAVGDRVIFHWVHNEKGHTLEWSDGATACWIPQWAVDAVVTCGAEYTYPHRGHERTSECRRPHGHDGRHIGEEKT